MEVGDLVCQGTRVIAMRSRGKPMPPSKMTGIVIAIRDIPPARHNEKERLRNLVDMLGRQVDVMWSNGKLSKNFAENSLEVISESR